MSAPSSRTPRPEVASRPAARRPANLLPDPRSGLAAAVAVAGTGRLRRLHRSLLAPSPRVDHYGLVAGLQDGLPSVRPGQPS